MWLFLLIVLQQLGAEQQVAAQQPSLDVRLERALNQLRCLAVSPNGRQTQDKAREVGVLACMRTGTVELCKHWMLERDAFNRLIDAGILKQPIKCSLNSLMAIDTELFV